MAVSEAGKGVLSHWELDACYCVGRYYMFLCINSEKKTKADAGRGPNMFYAKRSAF